MLNRNVSGDLKKVVSRIDISPAMFLNATEKYTAISNYLRDNGILANFYPQGSFRLGTVIRPIKDGEESNYDLDVVCELEQQKTQVTPLMTKKCIGDTLANSNLYAPKLLPEDDRCWTVEYADTRDGVGFRLDIVPSVHEDHDYIESLKTLGIDEEHAIKAISITQKESQTVYRWQKSNPQGYALWFDKVNEPYLQLSREEHRRTLLEENQVLFKSIESIPVGLDRSALQRVIQILKRHRDSFYTNARVWHLRPTSAIVNTLAAVIASNTRPTGDIMELLRTVVIELSAHKELLHAQNSVLFERCRGYSFLKKDNQIWKISNPVNPDDNFADSWTADHARWFFMWLEAVEIDFVQNALAEDRKYYASLISVFGKKSVESVLSQCRKFNPIVITKGTKPWRV